MSCVITAATRSPAVEYAWFGIRVNTVSPGIIQTPVHPPESYDGLGGQLPPLGQVGQVSDVVDGILFLESSPYITGELGRSLPRYPNRAGPSPRLPPHPHPSPSPRPHRPRIPAIPWM